VIAGPVRLVLGALPSARRVLSEAATESQEALRAVEKVRETAV
jgi:hypothetical protein